jgi:hypothetical protein
VSKQVPDVPTTIDAIMRTPEFELGVLDGRAKRTYRRAYADWDDDRMWNYERGRQWAAQAPRTIVLKRNGRITAEARRWFHNEIL